ncbi:MAG TPA: 50S ribosomal protein L25 [Candidatus Gracilibacteria bacterium]
MAQTFALTAQKRGMTKRSARDTRKKARVPGVVYGHGVESTPISVDYSDLLRTYRKTGNAAVIDLDIDGKAVKVLIKTIELDPVRDDMTHVDFLALNLKEVTTVSVPLVFVGESPAVKNFGGVFMHNVEHLDIRCLPADIPHDIQVDITGLENIHDHLSIKDLGIDTKKLEILHMEDDTVICTITGRAAEEEVGEETEDEEGAAETEGKSEEDSE